MKNPLNDAFGMNGAKYCAPGGTVTPDVGTRFAFVLAINGDALTSAHAGSGIGSLPAALTIKDGQDLPVKFTSVTLDAGSTGGLLAFHETPAAL